MGHHSRPLGSMRSLGRTTAPSTTAAIASRPSVTDPGEKLGPTARMPTNAEAQSTTVTTTAATPSLLTGCLGCRADWAGAAAADPSWGSAGCRELVSAVVAMVTI